MEKNLICISCPIGCFLTVTLDKGAVINVTGNNCPRGKVYAENECTNPVRMVTSTVRVKGGDMAMLPVKTKEAIAKETIFDCVKALGSIDVQAPILMGDVIVHNICGTGVDIIAARSIPEEGRK